MAQESTCKVAIIGGGAAGCFCAHQLQDDFEVVIFDYGKPLRTILPTGGGRCNLAHYEFDNVELAKNYPRGEKFLYSVFSRFATGETLDFFNSIGVETYVQEDMRVFPTSNSSAKLREQFLNSLNKVKFKREKVLRINPETNTLVTDMGSYKFDKFVIATGGHSGYKIAEYLGHNIIEPKPALTALKTKENFKPLAGVCLKNVGALNFIDDIIFTHTGVSGPLIYKISSANARKNFPYGLSLKVLPDMDFQAELNNNPHKNIKNLISEFVPKSFAEYTLEILGINPDRKCHQIDGKTRDKIVEKLRNFEITVAGTVKDSEVVTCGGVDLNEINPKTLQSKLVDNIFFCGEVLDIDGFCGGFNLQNCWSTAYCVAQAIKTTSQA